jgi:hypothetical protein
MTKLPEYLQGYCSDTVVVYKEWAFIERTLKYIALSTNIRMSSAQSGASLEACKGKESQKHRRFRWLTFPRRILRLIDDNEDNPTV